MNNLSSHRFVNSVLYLVIQLVAKESKAKEKNAGIRCLSVLFLEKRYISQAFTSNPGILVPFDMQSKICSFHFKSIFKVGIYSSIKLTLIQTNYLQSIVYTKIEKIVFIISDIFYRCIYLLSNL